MNCFDCAAIGHTESAVALCTDCAAGVCARHALVSTHWLTRTAALNRTIVVDTPARTIRCTVCQAARDAAPGRHGRTAQESPVLSRDT